MQRVLVALFFAAAVRCDEVDCKGMRTKALRQWLAARGLKCEGCAEKSDFVSLCEANKDAPIAEPPSTEPTAGKDAPNKDQSIDDLLASMKGIPGMEGIKVFGADDLKDPAKMAEMAGGGRRRPPPKRPRSEWRAELVDFYKKYGLEDKLDGVDAAVDKWKGREDKVRGCHA